MKKILILVSLLVAILLTGCDKNEEVNNSINTNLPDDVSDIQEHEESASTNNENEPITNTNLIEAGYHFDIGDANVVLPKVTFSSEDADKFNKEMDDIAKKVKDANGEAWGNYSYMSNTADDKLYILVVYAGYDGKVDYNSYIFDITNKTLLKNVEALGQEKTNEIMSKLPEIYDKIFSESYGKYFENEEFAKNHSNLESDNKANIEEITYYLDADQGAQVVLEIVSIAGPSTTNMLINLNDYLND